MRPLFFIALAALALCAFNVTEVRCQYYQLGNKLVGTGAGFRPYQGHSVAISGDGTTALVGGYDDDLHVGATWVYTRGPGGWTQQGNKLTGNDAALPSRQGVDVALSYDGNTALVGGFVDNNGAGAAWVYTRSGVV